MRRDAWVFDQHLDDSKQWWAGDYECEACGYEFTYVRRDDRKLVCPRCTITDRVTPLRYDPREYTDDDDD